MSDSGTDMVVDEIDVDELDVEEVDVADEDWSTDLCEGGRLHCGFPEHKSFSPVNWMTSRKSNLVCSTVKVCGPGDIEDCRDLEREGLIKQLPRTNSRRLIVCSDERARSHVRSRSVAIALATGKVFSLIALVVLAAACATTCGPTQFSNGWARGFVAFLRDRTKSSHDSKVLRLQETKRGNVNASEQDSGNSLGERSGLLDDGMNNSDMNESEEENDEIDDTGLGSNQEDVDVLHHLAGDDSDSNEFGPAPLSEVKKFARNHRYPVRLRFRTCSNGHALKRHCKHVCLQTDPMGVGPLGLTDCAGDADPNQEWLVRKVGENLHFISRLHGSCLSLSSSNLSLQQCAKDDASQRWIYSADTGVLFHPQSWKCLLHKRAELQVDDCSKHVPAERLVVSRLQRRSIKTTIMEWPSSPAQIMHAATKMCLAFRGTVIIQEPCDTHSAVQMWVHFKQSGQIMTFWHDKCIQFHKLNENEGSAVLAECSDHRRYQRWHNHGHHRLSVAGMCLHVKPWPLFTPCYRNPAGQVWRFIKIPGWPRRGGIEPYQRAFKVRMEDLPPVIPPESASCHYGSENYGHCGAEKLHRLSETSNNVWEALRYDIWKMTKPYKVVVHIGDDRGLLFRYGKRHQDRKVSIASEFKPITTALVMRMVELGVFGLDDKVSRWLRWWPADEADSRSYITIRHCLAFTTGFYGLKDVQSDGTPYEFFPYHKDLGWFEWHCKRVGAIHCARMVLKGTPHIAPPGVMWTYTGDHLRIAAAVMVSATGKSFDTLLREHIFSRTVPPMRRTRRYKFYKYWNPASNVISSARDMQRFVDAYFRGILLSDRSMKEMEADSQVDIKLRYFMGWPTNPHPLGHGLFGLGWWRSLSTKTQCGVFGTFCTFAPSHFGSVMVLERNWAEFQGKKNCWWKNSDSCSFYYHFQNVDLLDSAFALDKYREISHMIERHAYAILSGRYEMNGRQAGTEFQQ